MTTKVNLKTKHMFRLLSISKKVGFTESMKVFLTGIDTSDKSKEEIEALQLEITGEVVVKVLENLDEVEDELYELIGDLTDKTPKEVEDQPIGETIDVLKAIFTSEEFTNFFG